MKIWSQGLFQLVFNLMEENDLLNIPGNIFNIEETGLQFIIWPGVVVAKKGWKTVPAITSSGKGETVAVLACYNAFPPYVVMKGVNKKARILRTTCHLEVKLSCPRNLPN